MKLETVKEKGSPRYVNRDTLEVATSSELYGLVANLATSTQEVIASAIAGLYDLDYTEKYVMLGVINAHGHIAKGKLQNEVAADIGRSVATVHNAILNLCKMNLLNYKTNGDISLGYAVAIRGEDLSKVKYVTIKVSANCDSNKVNV